MKFGIDHTTENPEWRRGVIYHVPPTAFNPLRGVGRGSARCFFIRIIIHNGFMDAERDESRPYSSCHFIVDEKKAFREKLITRERK